MVKNEVPAYEMISGAAIAFGALLLIIPGFATDILGFLIIFPLTRKLIFRKVSSKFEKAENKKNNFIEGEFEDIEDDEGFRMVTHPGHTRFQSSCYLKKNLNKCLYFWGERLKIITFEKYIK